MGEDIVYVTEDIVYVTEYIVSVGKDKVYVTVDFTCVRIFRVAFCVGPPIP